MSLSFSRFVLALVWFFLSMNALLSPRMDAAWAVGLNFGGADPDSFSSDDAEDDGMPSSEDVIVSCGPRIQEIAINEYLMDNQLNLSLLFGQDRDSNFFELSTVQGMPNYVEEEDRQMFEHYVLRNNKGEPIQFIAEFTREGETEFVYYTLLKTDWRKCRVLHSYCSSADRASCGGGEMRFYYPHHVNLEVNISPARFCLRYLETRAIYLSVIHGHQRKYGGLRVQDQGLEPYEKLSIPTSAFAPTELEEKKTDEERLQEPVVFDFISTYRDPGTRMVRYTFLPGISQKTGPGISTGFQCADQFFSPKCEYLDPEWGTMQPCPLDNVSDSSF